MEISWSNKEPNVKHFKVQGRFFTGLLKHLPNFKFIRFLGRFSIDLLK
jgi:hypothetical protein